MDTYDIVMTSLLILVLPLVIVGFVALYYAVYRAIKEEFWENR